MDDWTEKSFQRVVTEEIQEVICKSKQPLFQKNLKNCFATKGVKKMKNFQTSLFNKYRFWGMTEDYKFHEGPNSLQRKPQLMGP